MLYVRHVSSGKDEEKPRRWGIEKKEQDISLAAQQQSEDDFIKRYDDSWSARSR
jgi:hypothetical protein